MFFLYTQEMCAEQHVPCQSIIHAKGEVTQEKTGEGGGVDGTAWERQLSTPKIALHGRVTLKGQSSLWASASP